MLTKLHIFLKYFAILGLLPFSRKRQTQRWQQIYTLTILAIYVTTAVYGIIVTPLDENLIVSSFVSYMVYFSEHSVFVIVMLESMFSYDKYFLFLQQLQHIKRIFQQELHWSICMQSLRRHQIKKYTFYAIFAYGGIIISSIIRFITYPYVYYWQEVIAILIMRTRCLQAIFYMDYIAFYMELLNARLKAVVNCKMPQQQPFLDVNYKMLESFDYLLQMKCVYNEIFKFATIFNDFFGWSLFGLMSGIFLDLIVKVYWTFLTWVDVYPMSDIYIILPQLIPLLVIIVLMCYACHKCQQQGQECAHLVQKLYNFTRNDTNARIFNDLVDEFSMHIMQSPITIYANGFYAIDLKLLMQIFTTMVTYLVILMQFR